MEMVNLIGGPADGLAVSDARLNGVINRFVVMVLPSLPPIRFYRSDSGPIGNDIPRPDRCLYFSDGRFDRIDNSASAEMEALAEICDYSERNRN